MDPVSVFVALHDTKCLKLGRFDLKSGLVAPYYINLRRLPLYPKLMEAVVSQVVEKFLTKEALLATSFQLRSQQSLRSAVKQAVRFSMELNGEQSESTGLKKNVSTTESDVDSQLEEDELESTSENGDECDKSSPFKPIISGVPYGAIPLAATIAYKAQLPYLFERKGSKAYGDQQCLMDDFQSVEDEQAGARQRSVILIEDVICSGESILDTVRNLEARNLKVEFVICIVDREENGIKLLLEQAGIRVLPLYNISAILRILEATGRISSEQFVQIRQWMSKNKFQKIGLNPNHKSAGVEVEPPTKQDMNPAIPVAV